MRGLCVVRGSGFARYAAPAKNLRGSPPAKSTGKLVFDGWAGLDAGVSELLVCASTYISPGVVAGGRYAEALSGLSVGLVRVRGESSVSDWKLHLRIAGDGVLDLYRECVEGVLGALSGERNARARSLRELAELRRARVTKYMGRC